MDPVRVSLVVLAAYFLYAAYLQLNDPDPLVWVPAYLLSAALAFRSAVVDQSGSGAAAAWAVAASAWAVQLWASKEWPVVERWTDFLDVEEGRELGGLVIVVVGMGFAALYHPGPRASATGARQGLDRLLRTVAAALLIAMAVGSTLCALFPPYRIYEVHCGAKPPTPNDAP